MVLAPYEYSKKRLTRRMDGKILSALHSVNGDSSTYGVFAISGCTVVAPMNDCFVVKRSYVSLIARVRKYTDRKLLVTGR